MDCLTQVNEEQKLSAISEPDFDFEAVELPEEGPLTFEFDIEVRPEFEMPQWRGLKIEKPVREFNDADVEETLQNILARRGRLVPFDGPAVAGRLHHREPDVQARRRGVGQRRGRGHPHSARAEFPRRQHRAVRQADGGRSRRRNPRRARPI